MIDTNEINFTIAKYNIDRKPNERVKLIYIKDILPTTATIMLRRKKSVLRIIYQERNTGLPQCDVCAGQASIHWTMRIAKGEYQHMDGIVLKELRLGYDNHMEDCSERKRLMNLAETIGRVAS